MQKSLEVMQRRNRRLLEINAEQSRAISKLYSMIMKLRPLIVALSKTEVKIYRGDPIYKKLVKEIDEIKL